ncbi:hypothetical protein G7046_g2107 [Stylonectria norvegica]|nr:hypothetical protein G7046_g2107 [Stylonectria norvegica]
MPSYQPCAFSSIWPMPPWRRPDYRCSRVQGASSGPCVDAHHLIDADGHDPSAGPGPRLPIQGWNLTLERTCKQYVPLSLSQSLDPKTRDFNTNQPSPGNISRQPVESAGTPSLDPSELPPAFLVSRPRLQLAPLPLPLPFPLLSIAATPTPFNDFDDPSPPPPSSVMTRG